MEDYINLMKEGHEQMKSKSGTVAVKDLTLCQRQKIFKIVDPIPMTDEELYNYVSGQASARIHNFVSEDLPKRLSI
ncbi:MAG: hypothetical protein M3P08_08330 [Thermoproteota archaeon]|jgi:hypothetical protein|nr:hypothetical protein [Thermoproteota archaeon]